MSNILKQHAIKHYGGLEANLPTKLPYGDTYFSTDTNRLFKYNQDSLPYPVGTGEQGAQGIQGEQGESGVGVGNTGEPFLLTAQSGGSSTYVDSKDTIYLSWSGSQGTYHLTLPSAISNPYRIIRVINDGTLGAQDKVHIVSPSPQTIDGVAEYVLNKSYSGIQAWSNGSNWIVIQAKSH